MRKKLKVYAGAEHPHQAQKPGPRAADAGATRVRDEEIRVSDIQYYGTGRRKTVDGARLPASRQRARCRSTAATSTSYFPNDVLKMVVSQPLLLTETAEKFDIVVTVAGGGCAGQAGAIRHGISRALLEFNVELRERLKTRRLPDARPAQEGTQEVRSEGRARPLPVQQALSRYDPGSRRGSWPTSR